MRSIVNKSGHEVNDPNPHVEMLEGKGDPELDRLRSLVRTEFSRFAMESGYESFEDADDFDVNDPFEQPLPDTIYMEPEFPSSPDREAVAVPQGDGGEPVASPPEPSPSLTNQTPEASGGVVQPPTVVSEASGQPKGGSVQGDQ